MEKEWNRTWLLENAGIPIRYILTGDRKYLKRFLQNGEVSDWLLQLSERAKDNTIGEIHGSHDYRMENILGKCWILGLSKSIDVFAENMAFIQKFLNEHIQTSPSKELSFGKLYHYRDYEKVLSCFLPLLGYFADDAVKHIARQRIGLLYPFTKQKRYDIYIDGAQLKGIKKEWQPFVINPDLYADGHIILPDMHDLLLFAGMYQYLTAAEQQQIETIVAWFFDDNYQNIIRRYGYFYVPEGNYHAKAIIFKLHLTDFQNAAFDKGDLSPLLFNLFVLSHFETARSSEWFRLALTYLNQFKNENGRYRFPSHFITEKKDAFVIFGGHMNVGEAKRNNLYHEVISTYWMERIMQKSEI